MCGFMFADNYTHFGSVQIGVDDSDTEFGDGTIYVREGIINSEQVIIDLADTSATAFQNATSVSTTTLVASATTYTLAKGDFTNIIYPRNVIAKVDFAAGVATTTVTGTCLITGTDARGNAQTETLTISTTSVTGDRAYNSITSITWTVTAISGRTNTGNALLDVGSGNKIGLRNNITAAGDIQKVIEAGALTTTYTLSTTYDTITFVNAGDGSKDYHILYNVIER